MLSTKIRTTILALAAVTALSGTAAPLAGAQAIGPTASAQTCAQWLGWFQEDVKRANEAVGSGNAKQVTKSYEDAAYDLKLASDAGCSWATTAKPPKRPPRSVTVVSRVGAARLAR
jgi:hypothetical protein